MVLGDVIDHRSGEKLDLGLAVFMPGPRSFTGEDICEFHLHGSPAIVQKVLRSLFSFGVVPAEAGEFTKRAFLNGKIDLAQAEAICDLINATGEQALKVATEQLHGRLSSAVEQIGEPLRDLLAEIEAGIDFPEEDISPARLVEMAHSFTTAELQIDHLLKSYEYGHKVKEGFKVLLCGRPNVGKSSILNLLLGRDRAIVSEISGTTRDLIEEEAIFSGYRFIFCDSAGLTETQDQVEQIGIARARDRIGWADLVIIVADATESGNQFKAILEQARPKARKIWLLVNKIDLNATALSTVFCESSVCSQNFYLSAKTKSGFDSLVQALVEEVSESIDDSAASSGVVTNERHRSCLSLAQESLQRARHGIESSLPAEIISGEVRLALTALEEIVGRTYTEDILGRIFSKFCIGK
jgi:tRNA modification GTPase